MRAVALLAHLRDVAQGKAPLGKRRSSEWPRVRRQHLAKHPHCEVCGSTAALEVHHLAPFHLHPELELEPTNLLTLCESGHNGVSCHQWFGHLGNFQSINPAARGDARTWAQKLLRWRKHA